MANEILRALKFLFPGDLDSLTEETSPDHGPRPCFLEDTSQTTLVSLFGNTTEYEFGAEQVVLVRDEDAKRALQEQWRFDGVVMTVQESKGLEFKDVLIWNFFGSSKLTPSEWRTLGAYLKEQGLWGDEPISKDARIALPRQLAEELKQLYVAATRAREHLVLLDDDRQRRKPMLDLLSQKGLVDTRWSSESTLAKKSSPEDWRAKGLEMFQNDNVDEAYRCFIRAGECGAALAQKTLATMKCRQAEEEEGNKRYAQAADLYREACDVYTALQEQEQVRPRGVAAGSAHV
jgi:ATP-dependent exoDNAse (exonuclease V) beta subunit